MKRSIVSAASAAFALLGIPDTPARAEQAAGRPQARMFFVFFAGGSGEVPSRFDADLREASCHMVPGVSMKIRGYADRTGAPADNLRLSELRSMNVVNGISRFGVLCGRLNDHRGLGEENTPGQVENRPFSRRVEVSVEGVLPGADAIEACKASTLPVPAPPPCVKTSKNAN